jgi:hypothetical protein
MVFRASAGRSKRAKDKKKQREKIAKNQRLQHDSGIEQHVTDVLVPELKKVSYLILYRRNDF